MVYKAPWNQTQKTYYPGRNRHITYVYMRAEQDLSYYCHVISHISQVSPCFYNIAKLSEYVESQSCRQ